MQAGKLRSRINLLLPSTQKDTFGALKNPVAFSTVWARVEALNGRELYKAQQWVSEVTHKVTIRYQPGIVAKMLVDLNGRIFRIEAVMNPEEQQISLELLCVETNDGANTVPALFLVSGTVSNGSGATIVFSGGPSSVTVTADSGGNYSALLLSGTYTVTPTLAGHVITPTFQSIQVADQPVTGVNFTAA